MLLSNKGNSAVSVSKIRKEQNNEQNNEKKFSTHSLGMQIPYSIQKVQGMGGPDKVYEQMVPQVALLHQ